MLLLLRDRFEADSVKVAIRLKRVEGNIYMRYNSK
jgi:hypothetical protein